MGNSNPIANSRNYTYTCANNLMTKIKFEYNEEANLVRDLYNSSRQSKLILYSTVGFCNNLYSI